MIATMSIAATLFLLAEPKAAEPLPTQDRASQVMPPSPLKDWRAGSPPVESPSPNPASASDASAVAVPNNLFLRQHDHNRNGVLEPEELPKYLAKRFAQCDINHNGVLEPEEILGAPNRIGRRARRSESPPERAGGLAGLGGREGAAEKLLPVAREVLRQMDLNNDGWVDQQEMGVVFNDPQVFLAQGLSAVQTLNDVQPAVATGPVSETPVEIPAVATRAQPSTAAAPGDPDALPAAPSTHAPTARSSRKGDDLPTAPQIVNALDRNKNGVVDRDEAVDKLADNFKMLDKDKSGGLDPQEIDRGLRLARMFGIKPNYLSRKPVENESNGILSDPAGDPRPQPRRGAL